MSKTQFNMNFCFIIDPNRKSLEKDPTELE